MQWFGLILFCAVFNRLRGDGRWLWGGSGRALWYVAPAIGFAAAVYTGDIVLGAIWGAGYALWGVWAWGYLQLLGHPVVGKEPSRLEVALLEWSSGNVYTALSRRHLFALPAFAAASWWTGHPWSALLVIPFAWLTVAAYAAAWRWRPDAPIIWGELSAGALWGVAILTI